jgi:predicted nucleotidyltransferase
METVRGITAKLKGFCKDKPLKKAYLFGSVVRQEVTPTSDIGILVELESTKTMGMIEYIKIIEALEEMLSGKVDLVATDGLSPYIKPAIDKEKGLIYEA